jgi:hypothetical protein
MRQFAILLVVLLSFVAAPLHAQITIPNTLVAGNVITAAGLNTNFSTLGEKALNRITGGTIEGNITLTANVTFDGVDISDYLNTVVQAQGLGTVTDPAFSVSTDTNTGLYFPAADSVAFTLGGTQRLLLNASGLTIFGVNIVNGDGKIPALSSTYVASSTIAGAWTFSGKPTFTSGAGAPLITGAVGGNFLEFTSTGGGATTWLMYLNGSGSMVFYEDGADRVTFNGQGDVSATTFQATSYFQGAYRSSDTTAGMTGSCGAATTLTVKDGIVTACS